MSFGKPLVGPLYGVREAPLKHTLPNSPHMHVRRYSRFVKLVEEYDNAALQDAAATGWTHAQRIAADRTTAQKRKKNKEMIAKEHYNRQETESVIATGRIVFGSELKIASNQEARAFVRMSQAVARHGQAREAIRQHYLNKIS